MSDFDFDFEDLMTCSIHGCEKPAIVRLATTLTSSISLCEDDLPRMLAKRVKELNQTLCNKCKYKANGWRCPFCKRVQRAPK